MKRTSEVCILGWAKQIDGVFLACGFSGYGFMHSPAVGRLVAEILLAEKPSLDISPLALERFQAGIYRKEECFI